MKPVSVSPNSYAQILQGVRDMASRLREYRIHPQLAAVSLENYRAAILAPQPQDGTVVGPRETRTLTHVLNNFAKLVKEHRRHKIS